VPIAAEDIDGLVHFAAEEAFDLVIVGPETPLSAGIVDRLAERGIQVFGPNQAAAQIEASKTFAKQLMEEAHIPTARYARFTDADAAMAYVREQGAPIVVKADGLAAGKGVVVAQTVEEALDAVRMMLNDRIFGSSGASIVVEEFMAGEEATVLAFVDSQTIRVMEPSQDHKPVYDGDKGPNTGGMGTYSPVPAVDKAMLQRVETEMIRPLLDALRRRGIVYKGVLYVGLMLTNDGPKVVEFNARFGDPETQVILPRLNTDFLDIALAVCEDALSDITLDWSEEAAVCVVMASAGYPASYAKGNPINGLADAQRHALVFHAGTAAQDANVVTSGGRVLGVTGRGRDLAEAQSKAYQGVRSISFDGAHYRSDIAAKALKR